MSVSNGLDLIRNIFSTVDRAIYSLIGFLYTLIVKIAEHQLIEPIAIQNISNRLYSFIGIFMLFKISFSLINYIINPDSITDKESGGSKLVVNIVITFVLIIVTPFGFDLMYQAQSALLNESVIPRIILSDNNAGTNELYIDKICEDSVYGSVTPSLGYDFATGEYIENTGEYISMLTIRPFFQAYDNVYEDNEWKDKLVNSGYCQASNIKELLRPTIVNHDYSKKYSIDYSYILSTVVGIIVLLVFVGFCLDAAVRTIKLYFLEIIAPIPIMSYIEPSSSKKGLFSKWLKEVGVTWADLFLRLAAVYFSIFIISNIKFSTGNALLNVIFILGALMFAKKLPDILKKLFNLDLKGNFKLNPLKNFSENAIGGKQIGGLTTGIAGAAVGGAAAMATTFNKGRSFKENMRNIAGGMGKGLTKGYKNPNSLKGLTGGMDYMKEQNKAYKEAKQKLKEYDKLEDKGPKYLKDATMVEEIADEQKMGSDGKMYNVKTKKYSIDESQMFSNPEYKKSFKDVQTAKKDVLNAKNELRDAQSHLEMLINNPKASQTDIDAANKNVVAKQATVEKLQTALDTKKERHKLVQDKYSADAYKEKSLKEYFDRHPDLKKDYTIEEWYDQNGKKVKSTTSSQKHESELTDNGSIDRDIETHYSTNGEEKPEELFEENPATEEDIKKARQNMEEIEQQIEDEVTDPLRNQDLKGEERQQIYKRAHELEQKRDEASEAYEAAIEDNDERLNHVNQERADQRLEELKQLDREYDEVSREMREFSTKYGEGFQYQSEYRRLQNKLSEIISRRNANK